MLICYADNMLWNEEFLVLWENCESKNPYFSWDNYDPFTFENTDEAECKAKIPVVKNGFQNFVFKK